MVKTTTRFFPVCTDGTTPGGTSKAYVALNAYSGEVTTLVHPGAPAE